MNPVEIRILWQPQGDQVSITGPLDNKTLCLGVLERAKLLVNEFKAGREGIILAGNDSLPSAGPPQGKPPPK